MEHAANTALKQSLFQPERSETKIGNAVTNGPASRAYQVETVVMVPVVFTSTICSADSIEGAREAVNAALATPIGAHPQGVRCWESAGKPELLSVRDAVTGERIFVPSV